MFSTLVRYCCFRNVSTTRDWNGPTEESDL